MTGYRTVRYRRGVGILRALRLGRAVVDAPGYGRLDVRSPWTDGDLWPIGLPPDLIGAEYLPMTRVEALAVDAISRGRDLVCTTVARAPLVALRGDERLDPQPAFLAATDTTTHPGTRILWTVDDLIFTGWSLWIRENGADGFPVRVDRIPRARWEFDAVGRILVDGELVSESSVILIPGPHEGILSRNAATIRAAARLERAAAARAANPVPLVELHQTTDVAIEDEERDALLANFGRAVTAANGGTTGVAFTSYGVEARAIGANGDGAASLVESRNYAAVTAARVIGLPAAMVDATSAGASLTYETTSGRRAQFVDEVRAYSDAIEWRLSLDDVVARGTRVAFDVDELTTLTPDPTGPARED
jgi:hypothetical protein